jgi:hypothetical protein
MLLNEIDLHFDGFIQNVIMGKAFFFHKTSSANNWGCQSTASPETDLQNLH